MATINTLLLSGENNHDWKRSAPFCKTLLEGSGKFSVDMALEPAKALADAEALKKYQLLFLDYNGPDWGEPARANFANAVRSGVGVFVLHAANNAFGGWEEYEKIVGALWRRGTSHGKFHEFKVAIVDHDHPVTKDCDDFLLWDELYHRLVNPQDVPYRVLAAAYSDPETRGSGRHEPVLLTLQYGQGRVCHSVLGHVWEPQPGETSKGQTMITFENPAFQRLILRGCEWAATGAVTE